MFDNIPDSIEADFNGNKAPITQIDPTIWQKLTKKPYRPLPDYKCKQIIQEAIAAGIPHVDENVYHEDVLLPRFSKPVDEWVETALDPYLELADLAVMIAPPDVDSINFDGLVNVDGWALYQDGRWIPHEYPDAEVLFFDFEAYQGELTEYKPFMCMAIDEENRVWAWYSPKLINRTVSFGSKVRLLNGYNSVEFDRRYVEEFYHHAHKVRMLDGYAFYSVYCQPSERQKKMLRSTYGHQFPFARMTCLGGLKDVSKKFLGVNLDKDVKHLWVNTAKEAPKPFTNVTNNLAEIARYCYLDTFVTTLIYKVFYPKLRSYPIYMKGQIERSALLIGCKPIAPFQKKVNCHNLGKRTELAEKINQLFDQQLADTSSLLHRYAITSLKSEFYDRVIKSSGFKKFIAEVELTEDDLEKIELPADYSLIGNESDDYKCASPRSTQKFKKESLHKQAVLYLRHCEQNEIKVKIKEKPLSAFKAMKQNKSDEKCSIPYFSPTSKLFPVIIGMKFLGQPVFQYYDTWGCYKNGKLVKIPHPKKGDGGNIGTPVSKDFFPRVKVKELTSDLIDLTEVYALVDEVSLWEKFDKRLSDVYTHDGKWAVAVNPSGTVTGRMKGKLAVLMPKEKSTRAGSEIRTLFTVTNPDHLLYEADYASQEAEIFCAHISAVLGWSGLSLFELLSVQADIHQYVADVLSGDSPKPIPRQLAKSMNFANLYFAGIAKLAVMIYIAVEGALNLDACTEIVVKFQELTRGKQEFGKYNGGIASVGFNRLKSLSKDVDQRCLVSNRPISRALCSDVCSDELTSKANFNIQTVGQSLVDIFLIAFRLIADRLGIKYQVAFMVHDQIVIEAHKKYKEDIPWLFQVCHLISKVVMYKRFGIEGMPKKKQYFESIELDTMLRSSPLSACITPTNDQPMPLGEVLKSIDTMKPSADIQAKVAKIIFA